MKIIEINNFHFEIWIGINVCKSHQNGFTKSFVPFPTVSKEYNKARKIKESEKEGRIYEKFCFHHIIWLQYGQIEKSESIPEKRKSESQMTFMI